MASAFLIFPDHLTTHWVAVRVMSWLLRNGASVAPGA